MRSGKGLEQGPREGDGLRGVGRELDRQEEEQQAVRGEREGDRVAEQEEDDQGAEHDRGEVLGDEVGHEQYSGRK